MATAVTNVVRVPAERLQVFEPAHLGSRTPLFRKILTLLAGKRQSEIGRLLDTSIRRLPGVDLRDPEVEALRVSLLVLRDYVLAGNYPLVNEGRCYLAPVFDGHGLTDHQARDGLRRRYEAARKRAIRDRNSSDWMTAALHTLRNSEYAPHNLISLLQMGRPEIELVDAREAVRDMDARTLWRCVRATWSLAPEASAPGREVAFLVMDRRCALTPLAILQFRNVVPEIRARDEWLGVAVGSRTSLADDGTGFVGLLGHDAEEAVARIEGTRGVLEALLRHVRQEGLPIPFTEDQIQRLAHLAASHRTAFNQTRRHNGAQALENEHLQIVKRADTAQDLLRGIGALSKLADALRRGDQLATDEATTRDIDAGLTKLWHYHMGFVALEMSICGASPPFGAMRVGKLAASLAGAAQVVEAWGRDRPLGAIAQTVYYPSVRDEVPNPGPLVVFTSGLYPGHSAQYNRVNVGPSRWRKIGDTTGYGSSHISIETAEAMGLLNELVDGYAHVTRAFGEGSGPRFRAAGRALSYLHLPDLRRHETQRPLYALGLVDDPRSAILGWKSVAGARGAEVDDLAGQWWSRWLAPRLEQLAPAARAAPDLVGALADLVPNGRAAEGGLDA